MSTISSPSTPSGKRESVCFAPRKFQVYRGCFQRTITNQIHPHGLFIEHYQLTIPQIHNISIEHDIHQFYSGHILHHTEFFILRSRTRL